MAEFILKLSKRPAAADLRALQAELGSLAEVREQEALSFDLTTFALVIGFTANALQIVDILNTWFRRAPRGNAAVIRFSDGRELKLEANTDPEEFKKQLLAALKHV